MGKSRSLCIFRMWHSVLAALLGRAAFRPLLGWADCLRCTKWMKPAWH